MSRPLSTVVALVALLSLPIAAQADAQGAAPASSLQTLLAASAQQPAEHRALADYYRAQASGERAQAARLRSS
ncbi:MAG TPA: hypothetical protein VFT98_03780, partial [Myxococcota bacterium]|nr:hypothetical protein [Myxococcota bacterium]